MSVIAFVTGVRRSYLAGRTARRGQQAWTAHVRQAQRWANVAAAETWIDQAWPGWRADMAKEAIPLLILPLEKLARVAELEIALRAAAVEATR